MWRVRLYDEPKTLYLPTWVQTIKQQMELGNRRLQIYTTVTEKKKEKKKNDTHHRPPTD